MTAGLTTIATLDTGQTPAVVTGVTVYLADGVPADRIPPTYVPVPAAIAPQVFPGWTYDGTNWSPPQAVLNRQTLQARAAQALASNQTYLALAAPTQAQAVAQVGALTRQVNALIRLATAQFSTITDT